MTVEELAEGIRGLSPEQRRKLFKMLGFESPPEARGGASDPFAKLIGKLEAPCDGSADYEEQLYSARGSF